MPSVKKTVIAQQSSKIEDELLYLPSYFPLEVRAELDLQTLGKEEVQLREAEVFECIAQLRHTSKRLSAMLSSKKKNTRGQNDSGRAMTARKSVEKGQEVLLKIYGSARHALLSLSSDLISKAKQFPVLTEEDLIRKSTTDKRQLGDSHRFEGRVWTAGVPESYQHPTYASTSDLSSEPTIHHPPAHRALNSELGAEDSLLSPPVVQVKEGALWHAKLGLTDDEQEQWDAERRSSLLRMSSF